MSLFDSPAAIRSRTASKRGVNRRGRPIPPARGRIVRSARMLSTANVEPRGILILVSCPVRIVIFRGSERMEASRVVETSFHVLDATASLGCSPSQNAHRREADRPALGLLNAHRIGLLECRILLSEKTGERRADSLRRALLLFLLRHKINGRSLPGAWNTRLPQIIAGGSSRRRSTPGRADRTCERRLPCPHPSSPSGLSS